METKKKKGQVKTGNLVLFGLICLAVMGGGLILAVTGAVVKESADQILPALNGTGSSALTPYVQTATQTATIFTDNLPGIVGGLYFIALIGILGLSFAYRITGERFLMILFFGVGIMVILGSIMISNIYQSLYEQGGVIGAQLQNMALLSWLLLYSPMVMTLLVFIGGAIIFSGFEEVNV